MNTLNFSIKINATKSNIWHALWDEASYCDWVSVFYDGSYVVTDNWQEGSKVLFLAPDKNGIYSIIEKHIPNEIMAFKHIGNVLNGDEQPIDAETKKWTGASEVYMLTEQENYNTLTVEIDVMDEHLEYMSETFHKALEKIKNNSLKNHP